MWPVILYISIIPGLCEAPAQHFQVQSKHKLKQLKQTNGLAFMRTGWSLGCLIGWFWFGFFLKCDYMQNIFLQCHTKSKEKIYCNTYVNVWSSKMSLKKPLKWRQALHDLPEFFHLFTMLKVHSFHFQIPIAAFKNYLY